MAETKNETPLPLSSSEREMLHYLTCCYMMIQSGPIDPHRRRELSRSLAGILLDASRFGIDDAHERLLSLKKKVEHGHYTRK